MGRRFKKKPVEVNAEAVSDIVEKPWEELPLWVQNAYNAGNILFVGSQGVFVRTLEGMMEGGLTYMLIEGVNGEIYPCDPDIFAKTYDELIEEAPVVI